MSGPNPWWTPTGRTREVRYKEGDRWVIETQEETRAFGNPNNPATAGREFTSWTMIKARWEDAS